MSKIVQLMLSLGLLMNAAAPAAVQVRFIDPDNFIDSGELTHDQEQSLRLIAQHLKDRGERLLPGSDLLIEVTDLDLAGEVWPVGPYSQMVRIARSTGRPMMSLRYVLSQDGKELRRDESLMMDLDYLHGLYRPSDTDPIRYEKRMIDKWFASEFAAELARTSAAVK